MAWNKSIFCGLNAHLWCQLSWRRDPKGKHHDPREQTLSPGQDMPPTGPQTCSPSSPIKLPALRPALGSSGATGKQKRPVGCLTPPAHPAGQGSFPCLSSSLLWLTQGWIPDACISPPCLLFTWQLSTRNSFTSPLLTPRKHTVMKLILCYLSATQITALPVLHSPFSISATSPAPARGVSQTLNPTLSGLWLDHTSGPHQTPSQGAPTRVWAYFAASNLAR